MGDQEQLPGMERRDLPEIEQAADRYRKIRDERCALSKRESEAKSALIQVMLKAGRSFYSYNGLTVELSNVENVKVKSNKDEDDDAPARSSRRQTVEISEIPETGDQAEAEDKKAAAPIVCVCDHSGDDHEENGACRWDACDCDGFTPKVNDVSEDERDLVHKEAVERWRNDRPATIKPEEEAEDLGGTPIPTEYSQEEIDRMAGMCQAGAIGDKKKTVKIYYLDGNPFVITGAVYGGRGKGAQEVDARPILPLENCGDRKVVTYEERVRSDVRGEGFFQDMKINCGSAKNPKWWVMVGPKMTFTVASAKTPDPAIRANEPTLENALYSALDCRTGDEEKWQALRESGATDEVLTAVIREVFGAGGGSTIYGGYECKGGKSPQFAWFDDGPRYKAQRLTGKRLLAKVRGVMEIGPPGMPVEAESVAPSKPQINEHGVYVRGVEDIKIPMPKKAGKTAVEIHLVQDVSDKLWRCATSLTAGNGSSSGPIRESDQGYESREEALRWGAAQARSRLESYKRGQLENRAISQASAGIAALDTWVAANVPEPEMKEGIYVCQGCEAEVDFDLSATDGKCSRCWTPDDIKDPVERAEFIAENSIDDFTAPRCDECGRIDGGHADTCSKSNRLTYDDYLSYARGNYKTNHQSHARKMELRRDPEVDAKVRLWLGKPQEQQSTDWVEYESGKFAQAGEVKKVKEIEEQGRQKKAAKKAAPKSRRKKS